MLFHLLLIALLAAGVCHALLMRQRRRIGEFVLVYLLVGYCGLPQLFIGARGVLFPDVAQHNLGLEGETVFVRLTFALYFALAIMATLAIWLRGTYLIAPVIGWSIFWLSATHAHAVIYEMHGIHLTVGGFLRLFAVHGFVSVLLIASVFANWYNRRGRIEVGHTES